MWQLILAAFLMLYTLAVAWALLGNMIAPERAYLLIAVPCLLPMAWCAYGFLSGAGSRSDAGEQDAGLIVSAAGWLLLAVGLSFKHFAIQRAGADAYAAQASTPATPLCIGLGVLCLLAGAALSWLSWQREQE